MLFWADIKERLCRFRDDEKGTILVETVLSLPLLFLALAASYEFFEVHRYKSAREKATYTIADMLSREQNVVTETYIDNTKTLFDEISNDTGTNQIRVSIIRYNASSDQYEIAWSRVRGTGGLAALTTADVANDHDVLPVMGDGEEVILVESNSSYEPLFSLVYSTSIGIETRVFTSLRFAPQLCFNSCSS
ncbi:MAG: pilus assembly protein [Roseovarius sp.]